MIENQNKGRPGEDQAILYLEGQGFTYSAAGWAVPVPGFRVSDLEQRFIDRLATHYGYAGLIEVPEE